MRSARGGELAGGKCESKRACKSAKVYAGKLLKSWAGKCISGVMHSAAARLLIGRVYSVCGAKHNAF